MYDCGMLSIEGEWDEGSTQTPLGKRLVTFECQYVAI